MIYRQSGEIEIDYTRGVVYFHSATGNTILRICKLKIPDSFDPAIDLLDITHMVGASYGGKP
jgi:hypothetical protein